MVLHGLPTSRIGPSRQILCWSKMSALAARAEVA